MTCHLIAKPTQPTGGILAVNADQAIHQIAAVTTKPSLLKSSGGVERRRR